MENSLKSKRIAIIGAGLAGLSAAWRLSLTQKFNVTILEKSKTIGGRTATRRKDGYYWDNGANYFSAENPDIEKLVLEKFGKGICEIPKSIWTFDKSNIITPGDPKYDNKKKYSYTTGLKSLSKQIWDQTKGIDLQYDIRVASINQ